MLEFLYFPVPLIVVAIAAVFAVLLAFFLCSQAYHAGARDATLAPGDPWIEQRVLRNWDDHYVAKDARAAMIARQLNGVWFGGQTPSTHQELSEAIRLWRQKAQAWDDAQVIEGIEEEVQVTLTPEIFTEMLTQGFDEDQANDTAAWAAATFLGHRNPLPVARRYYCNEDDSWAIFVVWDMNLEADIERAIRGSYGVELVEFRDADAKPLTVSGPADGDEVEGIDSDEDEIDTE